MMDSAFYHKDFRNHFVFNVCLRRHVNLLLLFNGLQYYEDMLIKKKNIKLAKLFTRKIK